MTEIQELRQAVGRLHDCKARHLRSEPVLEMFRGQTVWQGVVEVFAVSGHPKAKLCYAWKHRQDDQGTRSQVVTVLGVPPVDSALTAVRVAIVGELKRNRAN